LSNDDRRLQRLLVKFPPKSLQTLANRYQVTIPGDITEYGLPDYLVQELTDSEKADILSNYAYAGRVVCHYLGVKKNTDAFDQLRLACTHFPTSPEKPDLPR